MHTDAELMEIIGQGESDCVEFTESTKKLEKIREAACAFANDLPCHNKPGFVFVGIKDDGNCAGLTIDDEALQKLGGLRSDGNIQPLPTIEVAKKELCGGEVVVIQVSPSDNPPVKLNGRCWIRIGARREQASAEDERRLTEKRRWGDLSYDMHGVSNALVEEDLDMGRFENEYLPSAVPPDVLAQNKRSREDQLRALRLITRENTPTVTAILLLGRDPQYWFPCAYIQFVRYNGNEVTDPIVDQKTIRGTLSDQLAELGEVIKVHAANALDTNGETHKEIPDYPVEALRELVRNAVIHRVYESSSTPVRVYWFADKVEIISPGAAYGIVNRENFGEPGITAYRNPTIAEAMKNMGFMQRFGMGIATAREELKANGNPPPEFDVQDTIILATIKKRQK